MKLNIINDEVSPFQILANIVKKESSNTYILYEYGEYVKDMNSLEADYYCRKARELGLEVVDACSYNGWVIREK